METSADVIEAIRNSGVSVTQWAKAHGFAVSTVTKAIHQERGLRNLRGPVPVKTREVLAALAKDGFWPADDSSLPQA